MRCASPATRPASRICGGRCIRPVPDTARGADRWRWGCSYRAGPASSSPVLPIDLDRHDLPAARLQERPYVRALRLVLGRESGVDHPAPAVSFSERDVGEVELALEGGAPAAKRHGTTAKATGDGRSIDRISLMAHTSTPIAMRRATQTAIVIRW